MGEEVDVGVRRVDVYGTELIAKEEAAREIAAGCFVVDIRISVDGEDIDRVPVAFAAVEGSIESDGEVELPVRVRVPNAESVMVMGKLTPDDCHKV